MHHKEPESNCCRVCASAQIHLLQRIKSPNCDQPVPVFHCKSCDHYSLFPTQYQQQKSFDWDGVGYYLQDRGRRVASIDQILQRLCSAYQRANGIPPSSFLDVGCAIGLALVRAESKGLRCVGIEPERRLVEYARAQYGVDVRHGFVQELDGSTQKFDLIYCEQVLEHVAAPAVFLSTLKSCLAPGGCLYIGVPPVFPSNRVTTFMMHRLGVPIPDSVLLNIFHDPDEHINVFTRRSMRRLAGGAGLHFGILPLSMATLSAKRALKRLLTLGASAGNFLLSQPDDPTA